MSTRQPLRATLHIGRKEAAIFWSSGPASGTATFALDEKANAPTDVLRRAKETLAATTPQPSSVSALTACVWRLVVAGGFYVTASRPSGRWNEMLANAAANELEFVCPVPLDDLQTATVPLSAERALVCGYYTASLTQWIDAAKDSQLVVEGVWTEAGAVLDSMLEGKLVADRGPSSWHNGFVAVEMTQQDDSTVPNSSPSLSDVRVYASHEPAGSKGLAVPDDLNVMHLPGFAAQQLLQTDPSESFNLVRDPRQTWATLLLRSRHLATVLGVWAAAFATMAAGNLISGQAAQKQNLSAQRRISTLWHQSQGGSPLPPLAVLTLEQQASSWRAARSSLPAIGSAAPSVVRAWASLIEKLPPELALTVSSLRSHGKELWIDGQVKSQANARALERAWAALPSIKADPMRLSAAGGEAVSFSVRMVMR